MCALVLGLARGAGAVHVAGPGTVDGYVGRHLAMSGTVLRSSGTAAFQSLWVGSLELSAGHRVEGIAQVTSRSPGTIAPGSVVRVSGTVERLPARALDGSTGYDDRMERQGVLAVIPGAAVQVTSPPPAWSGPAVAWRVRQAVAASLRARVAEPEATILLGLLLGIRGKLPAVVEADLVASGLVHLLAVSGLKVALVGGVLAGLLRQAGRRAGLAAIVAVFAYAVLGGASSAALRAAVMASLGLVAHVLRRDVDPVRTMLLAAAPMLGLNPALGGDLSFQYSFLGVAGILVLEGPLRRRLRPVPRPFREALSVSLAAQLATLPLTAAYFHVIPAVGPLANMIAVPLVPAGMASAAWAAGGLPSPGDLAALLATGLGRFLVTLAHGAAAVPAGALPVPWFGTPHAVAYYLAAAILVAADRAGVPLRFAATGAVAAATVALSLAAAPDGRMHVVALATPGAGALVTAPDGARVLVDGGASAPALAAALDGELGPLAPRLDALALTASAGVATRGLGGLGARVPRVLLLPAQSPGDMPAILAGALGARGTSVLDLAVGDRLVWHGLDVAVGACGDGISLQFRLGRSTAWFCSAGTALEPGTLPAGADIADLGAGRAVPEGGLSSAGWIVQHPVPGARVVLRGLGARLWQTSRDGPLVVSCDRTACLR